MITPPLSISARPLLTRIVPVSSWLIQSRHLIASSSDGRPGSTRRSSRLVGSSSARLGHPEDVRLLRREVEPLAVVEVDHDGGGRVPLDRVARSSRPPSPPRGSRRPAARDTSTRSPIMNRCVVHGSIVERALYPVSVAEENKEHPAAKAGRYVRAAGIVIGKEIDRRATAAAAKPGPCSAASTTAPAGARADRKRRSGRPSSAFFVVSVVVLGLTILHFTDLVPSSGRRRSPGSCSPRSCSSRRSC